jgi:hypothetical protein
MVSRRATRVEALHRDWCGYTVCLEGSDVIVPSLGHDFSPFPFPRSVDSTITIGGFGFFFLRSSAVKRVCSAATCHRAGSHKPARCFGSGPNEPD